MKNILVFSPVAKDGLKEAVQWNESRKPGLGDELNKAILNKINIIIDFPDRYPFRKGYLRETPLRKYPYTIVYRYNKTKKIITISAIYHTSRNPKNKYKR